MHIWKLFQMLGGWVGLSLEAGLLTSPLGETPHLISLTSIQLSCGLGQSQDVGV